MKQIFTIIFFMGLFLSGAVLAASSCSPQAAYQQGVQDARARQPMQTNMGQNCSLTQERNMQQSYQQGFHMGAAFPFFGPHHHRHNQHAKRMSQHQCILGNFGKKICGYGCVKTTSNVRCASQRGQKCLSDGFGDIACGYDCLASNSAVKCAKTPNENCVKDPFGTIKCGRNCRLDGYNIKCN